MRHNKHTKVFVAVLVLGLCALAVDRFVLGTGGPAAASAATDLLIQPGDASGGPSPSVAQGEATPRVPTVITVARRLKDLGQARPELTSDASADAFAPHRKWLELAHKHDAVPREPVAPKRELKLTSVITGESATAVINGTPVRVGQQIEGCTLLAVSRLGAVLRDESGEKTVLSLPENGSEKPR